MTKTAVKMDAAKNYLLSTLPESDFERITSKMEFVPLKLGQVLYESGDSFKMKARDLKDEFSLGGPFNKILLRYIQALITQISQTAVCNRLHTVEQQLCRWLLLSHDRLDSNKLVMTHDLISNMLGVRREGITLSAKKLADRGLIKNVRGAITILDRRGLEKVVCECYEVVNEEYERLLNRKFARSLSGQN